MIKAVKTKLSKSEHFGLLKISNSYIENLNIRWYDISIGSQ